MNRSFTEEELAQVPRSLFRSNRIIFAVVAAVICLILFISASSSLVEDVDAGESVVCQDPVDGDLHIYTAPGLQYQNFGTCTHYKKSVQIWFSIDEKEGTPADDSVKVRFNDGGHADLSGSIRAELPSSQEKMKELHVLYRSQEAIEKQLLRPTIIKAIYMTGLLMTSKESYAERRSDLINYIEDQAVRGVYKTISKEIRTKDVLTGDEKTVTIVNISTDKDGNIIRQEESPIQRFDIRLSGLSINTLKYDERVEAQIQTQQQAIMQVQTAIAQAKQAEQAALTATKEGEANAAKAKWEQEVIKAKAVTQAQQDKEVATTQAQKELEVAKLNRLAAAEYKLQQILEGEGEAAKKRAIMMADSALTQKLEAWVESQKAWSAAFAQFSGNVVPTIVMGAEGGRANNNSALDFMNIMMMKSAKDLALDFSLPGSNQKKPAATVSQK